MNHSHSQLALFNGEIMPLSDVRISPLDRGYHFGDGIYEVFRLYQGHLFFEDWHWRRFERSLREMSIALPQTEEIKTKCRELAALHPLKDAMLYLQVTRGVAPKREHGFPKVTTPQVLAMVNELPVLLPKVKPEGCKVITLPDLRWHRADIKSLNLLGNIMAATQAKEKGCYEAIFINQQGLVTECTRSSVFAVLNGTLRTMPLTGNILPGITRQITIALAQELNLPFCEAPFSKEELSLASEVFLTNTTADIYPITSIDDKTVGDGKPGPVVTRLMQAFERVVEAEISQSPEFPLPAVFQQIAHSANTLFL